MLNGIYRALFAAPLVAALAISGLAPSAQAADTGLASTLHSLKVERGKLCMDGHFHHGVSTPNSSKRGAFIDAMKKWESFTDLEYGSDWSRIRYATDKSRNCIDAGLGWVCHVTARPCRRR